MSNNNINFFILFSLFVLRNYIALRIYALE